MALKCKIKASDGVLPVGGSVHEELNGKGEPVFKGTCPECLTPDRRLTGKGVLGAHNVVLDVDTTIPVTDEGLRVGAPRDAAVLRELEGRRISAGLAPVPVASMGDAALAHRGATLVPGRTEVARLRDPGLSYDEGTDLRRDGSVRKTTTLDRPRGRDRFDPMITTVPAPKRRRTDTERRAYRRKQTRGRLHGLASCAVS